MNGVKLNIKYHCDECGKLGRHSYAGRKGEVWYAVYVFNDKKLCQLCIKGKGVL